MTSVRIVALALLLAAGVIGVARGQTSWPGEPPVEPAWPSEAPRAPALLMPNAVQQECVARFTALRSQVEKMGMAAKAGSEKRLPREEMCKLVTAYSAAEMKWVEYADMSMSRCGIPQEIVRQLKTVHVRTANGEKKLCAAEPAAAPTLSNTLDRAPLPTRAPNGPGGYGPGGYCWDPPVREIDYKCLPRFSGR